MKKVLSVVLVLMMVVAMAAPAFASTTTPGTQEITDPSKLANGVTNKVTGTTSVGVLKITVPTSNAIVLNPYALTVNVTEQGVVDNTNGTAVTGQIISPAQAIKSESTSKVKVSAIVTGTAGGNVKFATASLASDTSTKTNSVFMKLVAATPGTSDVASDPLTAITGANSITVATKASAKTELGTLDAGDTTAQYLQFQLQGDAVKSPTTPWTTKDTVGASIAFSFDLVAAGTSGGGGGTGVSATMSPTTLSLNSTTTTGNLTVALSGGVNITSVSWSSSDTSAATVGSGTGATETVTYVAAGTTNVTATVTGDDGQTYTATCAVTCS